MNTPFPSRPNATYVVGSTIPYPVYQLHQGQRRSISWRGLIASMSIGTFAHFSQPRCRSVPMTDRLTNQPVNPIPPHETRPSTPRERAERVLDFLTQWNLRSPAVYALVRHFTRFECNLLVRRYRLPIPSTASDAEVQEAIAHYLCHEAEQKFRRPMEVLELVDHSPEPQRWLRLAQAIHPLDLSILGVERAFADLVGATLGEPAPLIRFAPDFTHAEFAGQQYPIRTGNERTLLRALAEATGGSLQEERLKDALGWESCRRLQVDKVFTTRRGTTSQPSAARRLITKAGDDGWRLVAEHRIIESVGP